MEELFDASTFLSEAQIMWKDCRVRYVCLEGESDKNFFTTLLGDISNVEFRVLKGWEKVNEVIALAKEVAFPYILGIIDKDYHTIIGDGICEHNQLAFTDKNDIEMMLISSSAYDKFLKACGSENKTKYLEDRRTPVLYAAYAFGFLRMLSLKKKYNFDFDGINHKDFIDKNSLHVNVDKLIKNICQRTKSKGMTVMVSSEEIKKQFPDEEHIKNLYDYCNGHDALSVLSVAMTKMFASASANEYLEERIFKYLLMGYSSDEFHSSDLYNKFNVWLNSK